MPPSALEPDVCEILTRYSWPGNVRELENAIKHAVTFTQDNRITRDVLPPKIVEEAMTSPIPVGIKPGEAFECKSLRQYIRDMEREYVKKVLEHVNGDKARAAEALGVSLATFYRKLPDEYR